MNKRGQLTLFMIIGIILILSVGLATYLITVSQEQPKPSINLELKKQSIAQYIDACFSDRVKEARNKYGLDKQEIEKYVGENICKDFSEFEEEDLIISFTEAHTDVEISQSTILARMDYLVMMRLGLSSQSLEEFSFNMEVTTTTQIPTQNGFVSEDTVIRSGDGLLELFVAEGTIITDENGNIVDNPEITIKLTEVPPNPTTYGLGVYEAEPHIFFSQDVTLRLRYYDLHLGNEENLRVIKRPGPGYVWKIVPDQDAPYTDNNLMIARLTELSQIALTATCSIEDGEAAIYFYTNYVYIQNCEPCKCLFENDDGQWLEPDNFEEECTDNKAPPRELTSDINEVEEYNQVEILGDRGGTISYENGEGCEIIDTKKGYQEKKDVGGTGEFKFEFNIEDNGCIREISLEGDDVNDKISSVRVYEEDEEEYEEYNNLDEALSSLKNIDEVGFHTRKISLDIENTQSACSHARLLIEVSGTGLECPSRSISPAKCCTEENKEECEWEEAIDISACNKLGFHTLVQDTSDQALINKHLEVAHEFSGDGGWVLNTIWTPQAYDPAAYVREATELGLRPIIRLDINYEKPSMEHIQGFVDLVESIPELHYVQFLNEPNYEWPDWDSSNIPAEDYANMLIEFSKRVRALDKDVYIIAGNLGPNDQVENAISTQDYINAMFSIENVDELVDAIDIWGSHSKPRGEVDPVGECSDDCSCAIESVYGYRKELCLIKQKVSDFNKPVFITETGYINTANDIAGNMEKAFTKWNEDSRILGITIFILAPIGAEWADRAWATIPADNPENWQPTNYFTAIQTMTHSPVCPDIELPGPGSDGDGNGGPSPTSTTKSCTSPDAQVTLSYSGDQYTITVTVRGTCHHISHAYWALKDEDGAKIEGHEGYTDPTNPLIGTTVSHTGTLPGPGTYRGATWAAETSCGWTANEVCMTDPLLYTD